MYVFTVLGSFGFPLPFGVDLVVMVSFPLLSYTPKKKKNYSYKQNRELMAPAFSPAITHYLNVVAKVGESSTQDMCM